MKKIAVGDLGEFWYGDYKEPFQQLEGAVTGHPVGVVLKDDDGRPMCAFCGKTWDNLGTHVAHKHGLKARDYKAEVGLMSGSSLVSERERRRMSALALRRRFGGEFKVNLQSPARGRKVIDGNTKPEALNRTGRCYAQVLAVGRTIATEGRHITANSLSQHGVGPRTIETYFGSIAAFRTALSQPKTLRNDNWTDRQLLDVLRALSNRLGRPPQHSDLRRYGLPSSQTFQRRFGGLRAALAKIGVETHVPFALRPDAEIDVLVSYATTGSITKTEAALNTSQSFVQSVLARYGFPPHRPGIRSNERREWAADMARRLAGMEAVA